MEVTGLMWLAGERKCGFAGGLCAAEDYGWGIQALEVLAGAKDSSSWQII